MRFFITVEGDIVIKIESLNKTHCEKLAKILEIDKTLQKILSPSSESVKISRDDYLMDVKNGKKEKMAGVPLLCRAVLPLAQYQIMKRMEKQ